MVWGSRKMECFLVMPVMIFCLTVAHGREFNVHIDGSKPIHVVNDKSPSFAVGMGLFKYGWTKFLSNTKLLTLVKALGPSYLRMGGTKSDHSHFEPGDPIFLPGPKNCVGRMPNSNEFQLHRIKARQSEILDNKMKANDVFDNVTYTGAEFDDFMTFVHCAKWNLIFGLNLLDRNGAKWDPGNTQKLLQYAKEQRYAIDWELGNEPNSYFHKTGIRLSASDVAKAFFQLNNILRSDTWWRKSKLIGPDANNMFRDSSKTFFRKFLHYAGTVIRASTFHQYYIDSRVATITNFTSPKLLNQFFTMVRHVVKIAEHQSPNVPVWLGETSSAYGGGAPGLSNTFVNGFLWLNKLGLCASRGVNMVFRQTLIGGYYAMINDNFDPNPDYWLTLLYKRLVGPKVLNVTLTPTNNSVSTHSARDVRVYAHCTNTLRTSYHDGSVTIYYLNLSQRNKKMTIGPYKQQLPKTAMVYTLTSSPTALNSSSVYLNDEMLRMIDDRTLPVLHPMAVDLQAGEKIRLPRKSFGFIILPDLNTTACL